MAKLEKELQFTGKTPRERFVLKLQALEQEAYGLGLLETARAINEATRKVGWELERIKTKEAQNAKQ